MHWINIQDRLEEREMCQKKIRTTTQLMEFDDNLSRTTTGFRTAKIRTEMFAAVSLKREEKISATLLFKIGGNINGTLFVNLLCKIYLNEF